MLKPTDSQKNCIRVAKKHDLVVLNAYAGASKTTTLSMIAKEIIKPSLMLVFNKSAKEDALTKFPNHVDVKTTHGLAYGNVGCNYHHKLNRPRGGYINVAYTGAEIGRYYSITPTSDTEGKIISSSYLGLMVRQCVEKFEQSNEDNLTQKHVTPEAVDKGVKDIVLKYAKKLWADRIDIQSPVMIGHDTYMKLFQLSKPKLNYDVIYLDEAQDTSLCTLDIIMRQKDHCKIVIVGDKFQSIYKWRGAVNAMNIVKGKKANLNKSFRFGKNVSDIANKVLNLNSVDSHDWLYTEVGEEGVVNRDEPYTILYRTNTNLLSDAVMEVSKGVKVNLEIDVNDLCKVITSANELYKGNNNKVKHESLVMFNSWDELRVEAGINPELSRVVDFVERNQVDKLLYTLKNHKNVTNPDVVMTTAHKSKGREWDYVVLANDFPSHFNDRGKWVGLSEQECNLLYVACTRAIKGLEYNNTVKELFVTPPSVRKPSKVLSGDAAGEQAQLELASMANNSDDDNSYASYTMSVHDEYDKGYVDNLGRETDKGRHAHNLSSIPVNAAMAQFGAGTSHAEMEKWLTSNINQEHRMNAFDDWVENGGGLWEDRYILGMGGTLIDTTKSK